MFILFNPKNLSYKGCILYLNVGENINLYEDTA